MSQSQDNPKSPKTPHAPPEDEISPKTPHAQPEDEKSPKTPHAQPEVEKSPKAASSTPLKDLLQETQTASPEVLTNSPDIELVSTEVQIADSS